MYNITELSTRHVSPVLTVTKEVFLLYLANGVSKSLDHNLKEGMWNALVRLTALLHTPPISVLELRTIVFWT